MRIDRAGFAPKRGQSPLLGLSIKSTSVSTKSTGIHVNAILFPAQPFAGKYFAANGPKRRPLARPMHTLSR
jgi:hypothetical protein